MIRLVETTFKIKVNEFITNYTNTYFDNQLCAYHSASAVHNAILNLKIITTSYVALEHLVAVK